MLFKKDTIDPKKSRKNRVYGADAWTPTNLQVDYKIDSKRAAEIAEDIEALRDKLDEKFSDYKQDIYKFLYTIKYEDETSLSIDDLISKGDTMGMRAAYLEEKGHHLTAQQEKMSKYSPEQVKNYKFFIDEFGEDEIMKLADMKIDDWVKEHGGFDRLVDVLTRWKSSKSDMDVEKIRDHYKKQLKFRLFDMAVGQAYKYLQEQNDDNVRVITNYDAARQEIDNNVDTKEFKKWLRQKLEGVYSEEGIYNGTDFYTSSGNRKGWRATHDPVTAENIVNNAQNLGFSGWRTSSKRCTRRRPGAGRILTD